MEWKEAVMTVESLNVAAVGSSTTLFPDSYIDWNEEGKAPSLGFMDLLGFQQDHHHFSSIPFFDMLQQVQVPTPFSSSLHSHPVQPPPPAPPAMAAPRPLKVEPSASDQLFLLKHQPTTPNSSSISSESSGALNDEGVVVKAADNEEVQELKTQKELKPKKKHKRQKEARFAFMTKSEVDHLEDGYRWRKYGQKAVKNSSFPRSYYRCTTASCNVKKRVERSFNDPTTVVTTYEGQHIHPSPVMPRPTFAAHHHHSTFSTMPMLRNMTSNNSYQQQQQKPYVNTLSSFGFGYNSGNPNPNPIPAFNSLNERMFKDHGLLHDIILPPQMLKEEEQ